MMIFSLKGMVVLFISAYIPLFLIMSIIVFNTDNITLIFIGILTVICCFVIGILNHSLKRLNRLKDGQYTEVKITETRNNDYVVFIMTYLVPFFGININLNTILAMFILFLIIGYIYINTSLFTINPTLMLIWKYNLYQGIIKEKNVFILTKNKLNNGSHTIKLIKISDNAYLA